MQKEIRDGIVLGISVILIIVIVYFSTAIFMTGEIGNKSSKKTTTTTTQFSNTTETYDNMIILSMVFSQSEENYMVVFFSKNNISNELKDAISNYSGDTKLYKVNLDDPMNKIAKGDSDNLTVSNASDIKVKDNALITINSGSIVNTVSGGANIIKTLK